MFEIRSEGRVYNKVENPYVVFDTNGYVVLKVGEKEEMENYWDEVVRAYEKSAYSFMAEGITLMELPKDQGEIDKVFQISGYVGVLRKRYMQ